MYAILLQIIIIIAFPWLSKWICKNPALRSWLSPVILCYAFGILLGNITLIPLDLELAETLMNVTIVLAIPLLLFSTDLRVVLKQARPVITSFALCVFSGLVATTLSAFLMQDAVESPWIIAGMLVGIYTGGTPNMQAIGLALEAPQESIVLLNAADIFCGGLLLLLLLTSITHQALGYFLPSYQKGEEEIEETAYEVTQGRNWQHILIAAGLAAGIVGSSLGLTYLLAGDIQHTVLIILFLTTLSILAALSPRVQQLKDTFETGEYFLLMFCIALGMLANFQTLIEKGGILVLFTALALGLTLLIHLLLAFLMRIDRDTVMITFTAAVYGPAFIGQIASVIKNKNLVFAGIATGLLGYALGNYLGISMAYFLRWFFAG